MEVSNTETISYSDIENYCNELHVIADRIKENLDNVKSEGTSVCSNENWIGIASEYYLNKINNFSKNFDDIINKLEESILYMAKCSEGYQAIDSKIIKDFKISNTNISNVFKGEEK